MSKESKSESKSKLGKITRRTFLVSAGVLGGGLALGLTLSPNRLKMHSASVAEGDEVILNTWVKLTPDNQLTVIIPHSEMGQGVGTGLAQMLVEEMEADWATVNIEQAPVDDNYINSDLGRGYVIGQGAQIPGFVYPMLDFAFLQISRGLVGQVTGGSTAIRLTGQHGMRRAGAAAREMLLEAAAESWSVSVDSLRAENSMIFHDVSGKSATFGEFADLASKYTPKLKPQLKDPRDYKIVGTTKPRFDIPAKTNGSAEFGIDVVVPGMKYAAIHQAPVFGAQAVAVDDSAVLNQEGIETVVNIGSAVVVVGDSYWQANKAIRSLNVSWEGGDPALTSEKIRATHDEHLDQESREVMDEIGDAMALLDSEEALSATYAVPYLAHATMEPMNCTAWMHDGKCEIWVGHQNPMFARNETAAALDMNRDDVIVHNALLGGGFGRRGRTDYVVQAAKVAKQVSYPVKLIWSREQDMTNDFYRPAVVSRMKGATDGGKITAFSNSYTHTNSGMPDSERPFALHYDVANKQIERCKCDSPIPVGAWRSVDFTQMGFFNESFMDELAYKEGQDPLEFRLAHKSDPKERALLERLAQEANWGQPEKGAVQGVAIVESFRSLVGQVVEISMTGDRQLTVNKVTSVVDCGQVINPDAAEAQIHSGVIFGLTAAFFGEITVQDGVIVQQNFPNYDMIRLRNAPKQSVHFMANSNPPGGLGEPGTPPVAPALTNAIFTATGVRLRELPITRAGFRVG